MNVVIDENDRVVQGWESQAAVERWLVMVVAILGLLTAALQSGHAAKHAKWRVQVAVLSVVAGLLVSVLTVVNTNYFEADHRELTRQSRLGAQFVARSRVMLAMLTPANVDSVVETIFGYLAKIADYRGQLATPSSVTAWTFVPVVFAQGQQPAWVLQQPVNPVFLYWTGQGEGRQLGDARQVAYDRAVDAAVAQLQKQQGARAQSLESLRTYVVKASQIADSSFTYDAKTQTYRCDVLLRLSKNLGAPDRVRVFANALAPPSHIAGGVVIPNCAPGSPQAHVVDVRLSPQSSRSFAFAFSVQRQGTNCFVRLDEILMYDRSESRWTFDVSANGQRVFTVPERQYVPSADQPRRFAILPQDHASGLVAARSGGLELRVTGDRR